MAYNALIIAKYIIRKSDEDGYPVSNLQLQKILYYIQREFLQKKSEPLFDEDFEAWQFGPVVPAVYWKYCGSAALPLNIYDKNEIIDIGASAKSFINKIVEEKEKLNPWTMVSDLHKPERAWSIIFNNGQGLYDVIPKELIKEKG